MADILSLGDGPEPTGRRRRPAVRAAAGCALAAIVVVRLLMLQGGPAGHRMARAPGGAPGGAPGAAPAGPAGFYPAPRPVPGSLRLPVAGARPAWLWPGSGRMDSLSGLPRDPAGYAFTWVGDGWAVQADPTTPASCGGDCYGRPRPVYYLEGSARSVLGLGAATRVAAGGTPGVVWLTRYPPGGYVGAATGTAREVTTAGTQVGRAVRLPAGWVIARGTVRGLLLAPAVLVGPTARYELWKPRSGRAERSFRGVIAASGTRIARTSGCSGRDRCQVRLLDLRTGRSSGIGLPRDGTAISAGFSPDGRFIALLVGFVPRGAAGRALAVRLEVVSLADRRVRVVPPGSLWSGALVGFGWTESGDSLVTELGIGNELRLAVWSPGRRGLGLAPLAAASELVLGWAGATIG